MTPWNRTQVRARSLLSAPLFAVLFAAPWFACGSDATDDPLDPTTFGGMHKMALMEDCEKTVQCKVQQGQTLSMNDPVGRCVTDTAEMLNGDGERQDTFLANYNRCRAFPVCDYVTCAQSDGASYGDTQRIKLSVACAAQADCNRVNNTPGDDAMVCEEKMVNQLNRYVPAQQNAWEASFEACKDKIGCGFVECYCMGFFKTTTCVLGM